MGAPRRSPSGVLPVGTCGGVGEGDGAGDVSGITSGVADCFVEAVGLRRGVGSASSDPGVGFGVERGVGVGVGTVFGLGRGVMDGLGRGTGRMSSRALRKSFLFSSSVI